MSLQRGFQEALGRRSGELIVPPPTNPMAVARQFLDEHYKAVDRRTLRHHRNTFWAYNGQAWPEQDERRLLSDLYKWLEPAKYWKKTSQGETLEDFAPNVYKLRDLIDAIRGHVHLDMHVTPPAWLIGGRPDVVPLQNGLLHIASRELLPHSVDFFSPHVLAFNYDADAPYPSRWHQFLDELWPDDEDSQQTLGESMGYILGGETDQHKIQMLVGPKRSGKGTLGRVLTGLLGQHNVAAPTLAGLTTNFGLSPLIGRPLALISDARLGGRADGVIAVERLLSISGEDSITIDRKYREPWTGRLPTRFMILTNELPKFTDSSGALASRFVILVLTRSFYGREDLGLTEALLAEAPGIFNWALDGLDRLHNRGRFEVPASSRAAMRRLEDLSAPVGAFVRDRCVIDPVREIEKDSLWTSWKRYCEDEGRDRAGTKNVFYRDLHAAFPGLRDGRPRVDGKRVRKLIGIDLRNADDPDDDDLEQQSDGTRTNLDQGVADSLNGELVRDPVQVPDTHNPRSEGVVQDGPGSAPMYPVHSQGGPGSAPSNLDHPPVRDDEDPWPSVDARARLEAAFPGNAWEDIDLFIRQCFAEGQDDIPTLAQAIAHELNERKTWRPDGLAWSGADVRLRISALRRAAAPVSAFDDPKVTEFFGGEV